MKPSLASSLATFIVALVLACSAMTTRADPVGLFVDISNPNRIGKPGDVDIFSGTITNNTDSTLTSVDLFFNFSGYDAGHVELDQLLGSTFFSIAPGATSAPVALFTFNLASTAFVPALYVANLNLESDLGDFSDIQSVSIRTVPEPGGVALIGAGLLALGAVTRRKRRLLPIALFALTTGVAGGVSAQVSSVHIVSGAPGLAQEAGPTLMIAMPLQNQGSVDATNVQVTAATLRSATLTSPVAFPVTLGTIAPDDEVVFQTNFGASALTPNTSYLLTIRGTYQVAGATAGFTVNRFIVMPPATSGSGTLSTVSVPPNFITGAPFPSQPVFPDDDVNETGPPVATGIFVPGTPTPFGTAAGAAPQGLGLNSKGINAKDASVSFNVNKSLGLTSGGSNGTVSSTAEPSGATAGTTVFMTTNWTAIYSTDGGSTFKPQIDPTTVFPADAVGYCCDQVVQYVPSIDRFIWLLQGNGYRLASASPAQLRSSGATAWTYWNLTPSVFGTNLTSFDYPDMSVGNNSLYISWDAFCTPSCNGFQVARIPLSQIQAGGTITISFTDPKNAPSGIVWGAHLTQDTGDEIFWAGHNGNSKLQVYSLAEGSNTYFWRNVGISSWANTGLTSTTPDKQDWMTKLAGFPGNGVIGATRSGSQIWFGWSAGTDSNFKQPHVEMVTLDRSNNFNKVQQVQVWNNSYAFAYPSLATNACTGEIGFSMEYGGNGNYENNVVGFWGDFIAYITTSSNVGTTRYGDYVSIRQNSTPSLNGAFFDAFGYGLKSATPPATGTSSDVHYVQFGRPGGCDIVIQ